VDTLTIAEVSFGIATLERAIYAMDTRRKRVVVRILVDGMHDVARSWNSGSDGTAAREPNAAPAGKQA
jgi:hypothetical protein